MRSRALVFVLVSAMLLAGCLGVQQDALDPTAGDEREPGEEGSPDAGEAGVADPGWPPMDEARIRPGVNVVDGSCTSNFLFRTLDNASLFLGTAAHCVTEIDVGEPVAIAGGAFEGHLAYSSFQAMNESGDDIPGNDFALIALPAEARSTVHPAMLTFGGPTGVAAETGQGEKVNAHGNSTLRPDQLPERTSPREGYVTHHGEWTTGVYLVGPGVPGDSGSAVTTGDGAALGTLITLEIAPQPASNNVANLAATLPYANEHLDRTVELVTWPMQGGGQLPAGASGIATGPGLAEG